MGDSWLKVVWETVQTIVIALVLAILIKSFVVDSFLVQGHSMEPTLRNGERLLVNKFLYRFKVPELGDIVVFEYPKDPERDFIKRVIGREGDTIEITDGYVYVNGNLLEESYLVNRGRDNFGPVLVPSGQLFVLGDNRTNSDDSRYFGFVPAENLVGQAMVVYWPISNLRVFQNGPELAAP